MLILILLIEILLIVHAYRMCFVMYTDSCAWRLWIDVIHIFFQVAIYEKFYPSIWDTEIFIYAYKLRFIFNIHIAITPINVLLLRLASYIYMCVRLFSAHYYSHINICLYQLNIILATDQQERFRASSMAATTALLSMLRTAIDTKIGNFCKRRSVSICPIQRSKDSVRALNFITNLGPHGHVSNHGVSAVSIPRTNRSSGFVWSMACLQSIN